jgi:hypothetical protein
VPRSCERGGERREFCDHRIEPRRLHELQVTERPRH